MFGISMWEVVLILVVALIVLGPKQLTETARVLGKLYREIQKMASDVRNSVDLDALTSTNHYPEPPTHKPEPTPSPPKDQGLIPSPGEKSGPDFYADLLESSKEEEKPDEASAANAEEFKEPALDEIQKDAVGDQPVQANPGQAQAKTLDAESKPEDKSK
ncbi:MAG: twin-arginine translocase TatA/TatE family subunit [Desulfomonile tiedjei]|nr:twin-arginine translocase TatA/TatE family subunit [Desulfomonile tiedjei]